MSKAEINRANALHSTGPRTADGKARSSQNALRHGLTARHLVLSNEDRAGFNDLRNSLIREYQPSTPSEMLLVCQIADAFFRLARVRTIEAKLLDRALDPAASTPEDAIVDAWLAHQKELALLHRYAVSFERTYLRAIDQLRKLQRERRLRDKPRVRTASAASLAEPLPDAGFVSQYTPLPGFPETAFPALPSNPR